MKKDLTIIINAKNAARKELSSINRQVGAISKSMGTLKMAVGAIGFAYAARQALNFAQAAFSSADAIGKNADRIGITTDALQKYRFAFDKAGIAQSNTDKGLLNFTKNLGEARQGTGTLITFLNKYDKSLLASLTTANSKTDALDILFKALGKVENQSDKVALANAALGRSGKDMVAAFKDGTTVFEEHIKTAERLGIVIDESLIRNAEKANDEFSAASEVIGVIFKKAILDISPLIVELAQGIITVVDSLKELNKPSTLSGLEKFARLVGAGAASVGEVTAEFLGLDAAAKFFRDNRDGYFDSLIEGASEAIVANKSLTESHKDLKQAVISNSMSLEIAARKAEQYTKALYGVEKADLKVLEAEKKSVAMQFELANARAAALRKIMDIKTNVDSFLTQLREKGLSDGQKAINEIIRQRKVLNQITRQGSSGSAAPMELRERAEKLREVIEKTGALAITARKGSRQEQVARNLAIAASNKLRSTLVALAVEEGKLSKAAVLSGKSLVSQYQDAIKEAARFQKQMRQLQEQISLIKARIQIAGQQKLLNEAKNLKNQMTSMFSRPIVQQIIIERVYAGAEPRGHASGLRTVPYNNYPALLHKGETVLTATQSKQQKEGGSFSRTIQLNFGDINVYGGEGVVAGEQALETIRDGLTDLDDRMGLGTV